MLSSRLPSCARLIELRRIPIAVLKAILKKHQRLSEMNHTCPVPIQLGWVLRCRVVPGEAIRKSTRGVMMRSNNWVRSCWLSFSTRFIASSFGPPFRAFLAREQGRNRGYQCWCVFTRYSLPKEADHEERSRCSGCARFSRGFFRQCLGVRCGLLYATSPCAKPSLSPCAKPSLSPCAKPNSPPWAKPNLPPRATPVIPPPVIPPRGWRRGQRRRHARHGRHGRRRYEQYRSV
jgi:hypothetical protein